MPQDLQLDKNTHDLFVDTDLHIINEIDYLEQKVKIVLLFFFAEWFLDVTLGIKYWELIFVKNPNLTLIDSLYKVALTEINGISELTAYDSEFDGSGRILSVTFTANTDFGELTQEIVI